MAVAVPSLLLLGVLLPSSASGACPNEAIREAQTSEALPLGTTTFPACMALEMVSPPKKFGQEAAFLNAFSPDGARALFKSKAALAETPGLQSFIGDNYVATRGAGGWTAAATSPPAAAKIGAGGGSYGGPFAYAADLTRWTLFGSTLEQQLVGEGSLFTGGLDGSFAPLSPLLAAINDSGGTLQYEVASLVPRSAPDLSAAVFAPTNATTAYLPEDPRNVDAGSGHNSYVAFLDGSGQPSLELLARDKDDVVHGGRCGSRLGSGGSWNQGAISADGSRIYFSTRPAQPPSVGTAGPACDTANPLRIFKRTATPTGPEIEELIPGEPSAPGDDLYQAASVDGSKVFLTSPRKLTASDQDASSEACGSTFGASKGCDLYLYDYSQPPGSRLTQVSAGENVPGQHEVGKGADVLSSVTAVSFDGSHAYFVAQGILTADTNPEGDGAIAGQPNLYLYDAEAEETSFIGTLVTADGGELWGGEQSFLGPVSAVPMLGPGGGDGHILLFASKAPLTADDTDGFADLYRYDSEQGALQRISAAAPGGSEAPAGNATVNPNESPTTSNPSEQGRWVSDDGQAVAFVTAEPLAPGDEDGSTNSYLWKEGELLRLPGEVNPNFSGYRPTVSADGEAIGFTSSEALLQIDGDTAADAYLARVDGGFPNPVAPVPCDPLSEGACQGPATPPPLLPVAATGSHVGPGNPKAQPCKKGKVRKRGRCVKPRARKAKARKAAVRANSKHRGDK
jgi:hypothetical protein